MNKNILLKKYNKKRILITGASGLVGNGLVNFFNELIFKDKISIEIYAITRHKKKYSNKKIKSFNLNLVKTNTNFLPKFDYIFHCAGYGQPKKFLQNKIDNIFLNTSVLYDLSKKLKKNGKIFFMSSSELYSGCNKTYPNENDIGNTTPLHPRSSYIEGKRTGEVVINTLREFGINAISLRLSLLYGPGTKIDDNRVINEFIISALKKKKIKMLDSGKDIRHYIYISDAIKMIINITINCQESVYNIGGKEMTSIFEIAKLISKYTNSVLIRPHTKKNNKLKGAPSKVGVSIKRYENEFGKFKMKSFTEGLKENILWYEKMLKNGKN